MHEFQKWCQEILPFVQAAANGEVVEYRRGLGEWVEKESPGIIRDAKYRIKPKTIRIGEYDVPEPVREPLEFREKYWVPCHQC